MPIKDVEIGRMGLAARNGQRMVVAAASIGAVTVDTAQTATAPLTREAVAAIG